MKKKYVKPIFIIELFQLDASIAASCSSQGYIPIHYGEHSCTAYDGEFFNSDNCYFDLTDPGSDSNDGFCYHGPFLTGVTFISS